MYVYLSVYIYNLNKKNYLNKKQHSYYLLQKKIPPKQNTQTQLCIKSTGLLVWSEGGFISGVGVGLTHTVSY